MFDVLVTTAERARASAKAEQGEREATGEAVGSVEEEDRKSLVPQASAQFVRDVEGELDPRPKIYLSPEIHEIIDEAQQALVALPDHPLYRRGDVLVELLREPGVPPQSRQLPLDGVAAYCTRAAIWLKRKRDFYVPAIPPPVVRRGLLVQPPWAFPELRSIATTPVLRPDGTILCTPGYDSDSGSLYEPGGVEFPSISETPTEGDVQSAVATLLDPVGDFPFVDHHGPAFYVALFLTLLARPAFDGPSPLFAIDGNRAGVGKGLLADCAAIPATGEEAPTGPIPVGYQNRIDGQELRKALFTRAMEATPLFVYDNIRIQLDSAELAAYLTAANVSDRILGVSRTGKAPQRTVYVVTGNGLKFSSEMRRRTVFTQIWTDLDKPEERDDLKYPDLRVHLRTHRPELAAAGLLLLRFHAVRGWPEHGRPVLGSYSGWDHIVRGAVIAAGLPDPCGGRGRMHSGGGQDDERLQVLLPLWEQEFGTAPTTVKDLVERAENVPDLDAALLRLDPFERAARHDRGDLDRRAIGVSLSRLAGTAVGGLLLERLEGTVHRKVAAYRVIPDPEAVWSVPDPSAQDREGSEGREGGGSYPPRASRETTATSSGAAEGMHEEAGHAKEAVDPTPPIPPTPAGDPGGELVADPDGESTCQNLGAVVSDGHQSRQPVLGQRPADRPPPLANRQPFHRSFALAGPACSSCQGSAWWATTFVGPRCWTCDPPPRGARLIARSRATKPRTAIGGLHG